MEKLLQLWFPLTSFIINVITVLISVTNYIKAHKKQGKIKDHSFKDIAGYILIPIFLTLAVIIVYLGKETNTVLWISFSISSLFVVYLAVIAYLSFNATEIIAPEWLWKLIFNKISTRFEESYKSEMNILLLYCYFMQVIVKIMQKKSKSKMR